MQEIWKDIYFVEDDIIWDYRGLYQVSNLGNVKSLGNNKTRKEKILKQGKLKYGYLCVDLYKNGKQKKFLIHRLVAHMFIDGYFDGADIDHINTIRTDNRADNLRWCTRKENNNNLLTLKKRKGNKNALGQLIERWKDGELIDIKYQFEYVKMGFHSGSISSCCRGKQKSTGGYIFKYHME